MDPPTGKKLMTTSIRDALIEGAQILATAGITNDRMEAASLMSWVLRRDRAFLITHAEEALSDDQGRVYREAVRRRAKREPFQYITGHQEFFKLDFEVTPDVLIPRPETELVVETALDLSRELPAQFIADIGTGSGCIVVSLLHELPGARAIATDVSPSALRVAQENARRHKVNDRLELAEADGFPSAHHAQFSLIVSNPPYIDEHEFANLQPEVRDYEPRAALASGADGLAHVGMLLRDAPSHLSPGGYLVFEIGFGQRQSVEQLIDNGVWNLIEIRTDLQGIPRTLVLQLR